MATTPKFDSRKLVGPELAKFVEQQDDGTRSVIIELPIDQPQVERVKDDARGAVPHSFTALPFDDEAERLRMDALEKQLTKLTEGKLVRLDVAQAFVVDVTPEQLRSVSLLREVGLVRPNRTHHTADS